MVEATQETVNRQISFHKDFPEFDKPWKYAANFIPIKPKSLTSFSKLITKCVWSDCLWREGKRAESNFLFSDYCVLDVDGGYDLQSAIDELCDTAHIIATTKSHSEHEHRFRIILPWQSRISSVDVYRFNVERLIKKYDADPAGIDGARFFWPCKEVKSVVEEADSMFLEEVKPLPEGYKSLSEKARIQMELHRSYHNAATLHPWIRHALSMGCQDGERNTTIYSLAKALTYYGWSFEKILDAILKSPVPLPSAPRKEIENAIKSGMKKATKIQRGGHHG